MSITFIFELLLMGAAAGFLAGLLGIGGGMLMVPMLTFILGKQGVPENIIIKAAIATSLATILFTSLSSVRAHHKRGAVLWDIVKTLAPGILVGSLIGAQVAHHLKSSWLALFFALFVGFSATQMLLDRKPKPTRQLPGTGGRLAMGGLIGLLSAIVGAGGGFISVPFMIWCNVKMQNAVATSAALGFPIALAGATGYMLASPPANAPVGMVGYVYLPALAIIASMSVLTAPWGARLAHRMPTAQLKKAFALVLYALAAYMVFKAW